MMPALFVVIFALSRILGAVSHDYANFSAAYAFVFCAGVYFRGPMAWWLPLGTMLVTDIALNIHYALKGIDVWQLSVLRYQLTNYAVYAGIIWFGRRFKPSSSFGSLVGGGLLAALLFYVVTNAASWLFNPFNNPEYSKTLLGFLTALFKGTSGWPETWQFFRNTFISSGIFTALFVAAMKATAPAESPLEKEAPAAAEPAENEETPEEAKA